MTHFLSPSWKASLQLEFPPTELDSAQETVSGKVVNEIVSFLEVVYTLKTGTAVEDGDPILKLLRRVYHPEIQLGVGIHSELDFLVKRPLYL